MIIPEDDLYSYWNLPENLSQRSERVHNAAFIKKNSTHFDITTKNKKVTEYV
ncbi:hypothetical protein ACETRX_27755 [Labrys portucalensis]|uniref:Uncharacterized protein n=1 Tax=Labrys neptuniae TaxID=376174 RepID=A0ABV6ZMP2_9HYPH|nr:hypothetical protein [Labrys neptuniae]MDT3378589.1 hypothetical protein [Labrys neptuniae]